MISLKNLLNEYCSEVDRGKPCDGGIDEDWAGSKPRAERIAKLTGLRFGSQKRSKKQTAANRRSDHWIGSVDSYGIDLPARGRRGDNAWKQLRDSLVSMGWVDKSKMSDSLLEPGQGNWVNFMHDGYRYQIGWNVAGHYDHIHIGVRKKDVSISNNLAAVTTDTDLEQSIDSGDLSFGDRGNSVVDLQRRLIYILNDPLAVGPPQDDGIFGPYTEKGVITFQKDRGLPSTGIYDEETRNKLENLTADVDESELRNVKPVKFDALNINLSGDAIQQAIDLLKQFEGFRSTPKWDVNNWRIGYGSSTITEPDSNVIKLSNDRSQQPEYTISQEDADRDLARRIETEFMPKKVMPYVDSDTPDGIIAALTSVAYNYGSLPTSIKRASLLSGEDGDYTRLADAVRSLSANTKRRNKEADYILAVIEKDKSYV